MKDLKKREISNLPEILAAHKLWRDSGGKEGKRADLRDANLRHADLRYTDLTDANLRGAYLSGATLCDANLDCALVSYRGNTVRMRFEEVGGGGAVASDIPVDTPLGKTVGAVERLVSEWRGLRDFDATTRDTILALCEALRGAHGKLEKEVGGGE